jgi:outer membrane protein OmpA-like peptidoglycan-associated protein
MIKKLLLVLSMVGMFMVGNVFAQDTSFTQYYDKDPQCFMTFIFCSGKRCVSTPDNEVWIVDSYGGGIGRNYYQEDGSLWKERSMKNQSILPYNPPTGCPPGWICPAVAVDVATDVAVQSVQTEVKVFVVYFGFDKYNLTHDSLVTLREAVEYASSGGFSAIKLESFCDFRGSDEYNIGLGQRRIDAVHGWLSQNISNVEYGFQNNGDRLSEVRELVNGRCIECWEDRRVEIFIE